MPFCPKCREEFRPGFDRCEDCEADLVDELGPLPDEEERLRKLSLRRVFNTTSLEEASIVRVMLQDDGIDCMTENEGGAMYAIGLPTAITPLGISVRASDEDRAKEIITKFFEERRASAAGPPETSAGTEKEGFHQSLFEEKRKNRQKWMIVFFFLVVLPLLAGLIHLLVWALSGRDYW